MNRSVRSTEKWTPKRVRNLRLKFNETQETFAHRIGVAWSTLAHWETGMTKPSKLAVRLLEALEEK